MRSLLISLLSAAILSLSLIGCADERPAADSALPAYMAMLSEDEPPEANEMYEPEEISEPKPPPPWEWEYGDPGNHGVDPDMLEQFHRVVSQTEIHSVVIVRNGVIISENLAEGFDEHHMFRISSCTKSITGALIGIAIDLGYISGTNAFLYEFLPEAAGTGKEYITVENLLGHVSGIYWREWGMGTMYHEFQNSENFLDFIFSRQVEAAPGAFFNYNSGGSYLLSVILQRATGRSARDFANEHLFGPIGITDVQWRVCPQGYCDGGSGLHMTSRDAARFGLLYLSGGVWNGRQIIPRHWVEQSTRARFPGAPGTGEYGYNWWITSFGGHDLFYAMGAGGQYIFVVPGLELVTVINSRTRNTYEPQWIFRDYLIPAFR